MGIRVGVDIGGTFTDFCMLDETTGRLHALKVLSTPAKPGQDVLNGIEGLSGRYHVPASAITTFTHGTTVGINTIIQRKGARLALCATRGFADVLEIARLRMPEVLNLFSRLPAPLIPRDLVFEVRGRVLADGSELEPLSEADIKAAIAGAREAKVDGIIIGFLNAYKNAAHEEAAKALINKLAPEFFVFTSAEVWPVIREYERTTTAILNGYVHPRVSHYITSLQAALRSAGVPAEPMATKSNGGIMRAELGKLACVNMLLSGTAAGVIGATFLAGQAGFANCLTLDIGGTSADVAFILDGQPKYGTGEQVGEFPLHVPSVSVSSIGEGGGSIAWVDEFGVLKVGPESAGSDPGPACYGRGGKRATVTDAFAVLGFLGHAEIGFGAVKVDRSLAEKAVGEIAAKLGLGLRETAEQIVEICVSGMYLGINTLFAQRGVDPDELSLFAFGGAGPMLGPILARELGLQSVLVPPSPGVVSALGGLVAPAQSDFLRTVFGPLEAEALPHYAKLVAEISSEALSWLRNDQQYIGDYRLQILADMRYRGQAYEIEVPLEAAWLEGGDIAPLRAAFDDEHAKLYGFADPKAPAQMINLRVKISGIPLEPKLPELGQASGEPQRQGEKEIFWDGRPWLAPLYLRRELLAGHRFSGPAVVMQDDTTICIPQGFDARVDRYGNLILDRTTTALEQAA